MVDSAYIVQTFRWIISTLCRYITDILKICIKKFDAETIFCFLWLSLPGDHRVTDEALLAETT